MVRGAEKGDEVVKDNLKAVLGGPGIEHGNGRPGPHDQFEFGDELDHDLQETWAIHGLYPQMAWNPAGDTLYYWAGGRLNSINLDSRSKTIIPFQVDDSRTMTQALRFRQQLAPPQFEVKALRFATVSPAGDKLVF